jgi:hypothetical protein
VKRRFLIGLVVGRGGLEIDMGLQAGRDGPRVKRDIDLGLEVDQDIVIDHAVDQGIDMKDVIDTVLVNIVLANDILETDANLQNDIIVLDILQFVEKGPYQENDLLIGKDPYHENVIFKGQKNVTWNQEKCLKNVNRVLLTKDLQKRIQDQGLILLRDLCNKNTRQKQQKSIVCITHYNLTQ